jgi:ribonuclease P protein component
MIAPNQGLFIFNQQMSTSKSHSLGKSERLKSRKQIDILFKDGKKITLFPIRLLYKIENGPGEIQAGFTVSSKNFPGAVDRNRIKRLSREVYRVRNSDLKKAVADNKKQLHLFFIYTGREILPYEQLSSKLIQVLAKMVRIIYDEAAANT